MVYLRFIVTWIGKLLIWVGIASLTWVVFACDEFCEEQNRTAVVIHFYSLETDVLLPVKNVTITGIENDSLLYPNSKLFGGVDLSQVMLPVNPTADVMSFSIQNGDLPADTIIIRYTRHYGFISSECGCVTYAEIQEEPEITDYSITQMVVTNPNVSTVSYRQGVFNEENIRIYY